MKTDIAGPTRRWNKYSGTPLLEARWTSQEKKTQEHMETKPGQRNAAQQDELVMGGSCCMGQTRMVTCGLCCTGSEEAQVSQVVHGV